MLTSRQVVAMQFESGRRGSSYDEVAVDDFLDRVVKTLEAHEQGHRPCDPVTASAVDDVAFPMPRGLGRRGYDERSVDDFLTKVRETLRVYESRESSDGSEQPEFGGAAAHDVPSAITQPKSSFWSRVLGR